MHRRRLALALGLVTALIGTAALPSLGQESPAPSPSPSAEATTGEADDVALVVATALPDELAADLTAGLSADLLDPTGSPDREAALAALGGWSALLLPALVEMAGADPELLALLEAMGSADALEAELLADIAMELERATGADEPQDETSGGKKSRDRKRGTKGATDFGLLAATRGSTAQAPVAPAAEGPGQPAPLSGADMADRAAFVNVIQEINGQEAMSKTPAYKNSQVKDGAKTSFTLDLGSADRDFVIALEGEKDGQKASGSGRLRLKGSPCPDVDGTVKMEFKVQSDVAATLTAGSFAFGDGFEGTATGHVDDSATLTGFELEGRATTRKAVPGRSGWVEYAAKGSYDAFLGQDGRMRSTLKEDGGINPSRRSSQANREDAERAIENGVQMVKFTSRVFENWQSLWRSGWCVKVKADIPATLKPSEQRTFDVHVVHKDGSELDAPVDATLSGKQSLDPLRIEHAPGQLTYTAGDQKGDTATIDLVSTSRRGIGKLSGTIKVEEQGYRMQGGADELVVDAVVCDLTKPFTVTGSGITLDFVPSSTDPSSGGTYSYRGDFKKFSVSGKGTYTVKLTDTGGSLVAKGKGKATGPLGTFSSGGTEKYDLTPTSCE